MNIPAPPPPPAFPADGSQQFPGAPAAQPSQMDAYQGPSIPGVHAQRQAHLHEMETGLAGYGRMDVVGYTLYGTPYPWDPQEPFNASQLVEDARAVRVYTTAEIPQFQKVIASYMQNAPKARRTPGTWDMTEALAAANLEQGQMPDLQPAEPVLPQNTGKGKSPR